jgi:hypothetical protein
MHDIAQLLSDHRRRYSRQSPANDRHKASGGSMPRSRAAGDFAAIRARLEELRCERAQAMRGTPEEPADKRLPSRRAEPVEEQALLKRIRDRAPFSR